MRDEFCDNKPSCVASSIYSFADCLENIQYFFAHRASSNNKAYSEIFGVFRENSLNFEVSGVNIDSQLTALVAE